MIFCELCLEPLNPSDRNTYRRVTGWEKKRAQGGTNHLVLRETEEVYAHGICIRKQQLGVAREQETLL